MPPEAEMNLKIDARADLAQAQREFEKLNEVIRMTALFASEANKKIELFNKHANEHKKVAEEKRKWMDRFSKNEDINYLQTSRIYKNRLSTEPLEPPRLLETEKEGPMTKFRISNKLIREDEEGREDKSAADSARKLILQLMDQSQLREDKEKEALQASITTATKTLEFRKNIVKAEKNIMTSSIHSERESWKLSRQLEKAKNAELVKNWAEKLRQQQKNKKEQDKQTHSLLSGMYETENKENDYNSKRYEDWVKTSNKLITERENNDIKRFNDWMKTSNKFENVKEVDQKKQVDSDWKIKTDAFKQLKKQDESEIDEKNDLLTQLSKLDQSKLKEQEKIAKQSDITRLRELSSPKSAKGLGGIFRSITGKDVREKKKEFETTNMYRDLGIPIVGEKEGTPKSETMKSQNAEIKALENRSKVISMNFLKMGLGIMFFSMAINKAIKGLMTPMLQVSGIFELFSTLLILMFLPIMQPLINMVLWLMVAWMSLDPELQKGIATFLAIGLVIATLGVAFGSIGAAISGLSAFITTVGIALGAFVTEAGTGAVVVSSAWTGAFAAISTAIGAFLLPILIIIALFIGAVINQWDNLVKAISFIWSGVVNIFGGVFKILGGIIDIFIGLVTGDWTKIGEGFKKLGDGIIQFIAGIFQVLAGLGAVIVSLFIGVLQTIGNILWGAMALLGKISMEVGLWLWNVINDTFTGKWDKLWDGFIDAAKKSLGWLKGIWDRFWDYVTGKSKVDPLKDSAEKTEESAKKIETSENKIETASNTTTETQLKNMLAAGNGWETYEGTISAGVIKIDGKLVDLSNSTIDCANNSATSFNVIGQSSKSMARDITESTLESMISLSEMQTAFNETRTSGGAFSTTWASGVARLQAWVAAGTPGGVVTVDREGIHGDNDPGEVPAAEGGLFTKPTRALIGESGPELVLPQKYWGAIGGGSSKGITNNNVYNISIAALNDEGVRKLKQMLDERDRADLKRLALR